MSVRCLAPPVPLPVSVTLTATGDLSAFEHLTVELTDVRFHPADQPRDEGWRSLPLLRRKVTLAAGRSVRIAEGTLPPGTYDRVWVVSPRGWGKPLGPRQATLEMIVEPIALVPSLAAGQAVEVQVTLIVLERVGEPAGRYVVFTRDAQWQPLP